MVSTGREPGWRWIWSVLIWLIGTLLWTLAAIAAGATQSDALRLGGSQMAVVALLAPGIWWLSGQVPLRRHVRLVLTHGSALALFLLAYLSAQGIAWFRDVPLTRAVAQAFTGPVAGWNVLIGTILYLAIGGVCYARRAEVSLRESERARAETRVAAREAQLAALSAQLQPHFLFNALHTVSALLHTDPERADRALDDLGRLLRYALQEAGEEVTLGREWDFARDYLAFEGLRLGSRLRLDVRIDELALNVRVPPFVLQPLLENAIRHGVAAAPAGGALAVRISRVDHAVCLVVHNSVPPDAPETAGMAGTGLRRLRERLALTYGADRTDVTAAATPGAYEVTVTLPTVL